MIFVAWLIATHSLAFGIGGLVQSHRCRARRRALDMEAEALAHQAELQDARGQLITLARIPDAPRRRMAPAVPLSLLEASSLSEVSAMLATARARHAERSRQFVELMSSHARHAVGTARVAA